MRLVDTTGAAIWEVSFPLCAPRCAKYTCCTLRCVGFLSKLLGLRMEHRDLKVWGDSGFTARQRWGIFRVEDSLSALVSHVHCSFPGLTRTRVSMVSLSEYLNPSTSAHHVSSLVLQELVLFQDMLSNPEPLTLNEIGNCQQDKAAVHPYSPKCLCKPEPRCERVSTPESRWQTHALPLHLPIYQKCYCNASHIAPILFV